MLPKYEMNESLNAEKKCVMSWIQLALSPRWWWQIYFDAKEDEIGRCGQTNSMRKSLWKANSMYCYRRPPQGHVVSCCHNKWSIRASVWTQAVGCSHKNIIRQGSRTVTWTWLTAHVSPKATQGSVVEPRACEFYIWSGLAHSRTWLPAMFVAFTVNFISRGVAADPESSLLRENRRNALRGFNLHADVLLLLPCLFFRRACLHFCSSSLFGFAFLRKLRC